MMLLKVVRTRWFFQFVFISTRHSMSISYLILLSMISCSVSPSWPRSSPLGFCNSSHVILFLFYILSSHSSLSSASMIDVSVVCSIWVFWVVFIWFWVLVADPLNLKVWRMDCLLSIVIHWLVNFSFRLLKIMLAIWILLIWDWFCCIVWYGSLLSFDGILSISIFFLLLLLYCNRIYYGGVIIFNLVFLSICWNMLK